jgi:hypothetical protein
MATTPRRARNGRAVYAKVGAADRGRRYDTGGKWTCGPMKQVGTITVSALSLPSEGGGGVAGAGRGRRFEGAGTCARQVGGAGGVAAAAVI